MIESRSDAYVGELKEFVALKSVSAQAVTRPLVRETAEWIKNWILQNLPGSKCELRDIDFKQKDSDGTELELPPLVVAHLNEHDPSKKTLLVYAHYDVQPANKLDGWDTDPWELTLMPNKELRGRGSTDDKGPLLGWLLMAKAYADLKMELPINIRFISEGMEESGSIGFDETVAKMKDEKSFFENVDFACISDNYWLGDKKPCVTHGLRGVTSCYVSIQGPAVDLHSGSNGGMVYEPMDDLIAILASLKDSSNKILIPEILKEVAEVTEEEQKRYEPIDFDVSQRKRDMGVSMIRDENDKAKSLMNVWRFPCLSIHGIEGAYSEPGFKTVIPRKVIGKFSIRTVPHMTQEHTEGVIEKYVKEVFDQRKSPNKCTIEFSSGRWWYVDPVSPIFEAARKATETVHNVMPDYTREGGSIPITLTLSQAANCDICLLPMGRGNDGAHSQNEKLDLSNFISGIKVFSHFCQELATM